MSLFLLPANRRRVRRLRRHLLLQYLHLSPPTRLVVYTSIPSTRPSSFHYTQAHTLLPGSECRVATSCPHSTAGTSSDSRGLAGGSGRCDGHPPLGQSGLSGRPRRCVVSLLSEWLRPVPCADPVIAVRTPITVHCRSRAGEADPLCSVRPSPISLCPPIAELTFEVFSTTIIASRHVSFPIRRHHRPRTRRSLDLPH